MVEACAQQVPRALRLFPGIPRQARRVAAEYLAIEELPAAHGESRGALREVSPAVAGAVVEKRQVAGPAYSNDK